MTAAKFIIILPFLLLIGCNGQTDNTAQEKPEEKTAQEIVAEDNWKEENNYPTSASNNTNNNSIRDENSDNRPPRIESIEIQMLSNNPRDGFKALVTALDPEGDDIDFIYQWKYNGEDIIGETDQILSWQEEFSKGSEISIEVIPYDYEVQGIWKSEGSFIIPNSPPRISSSPPGELEEGIFRYAVEAEDPDGDQMDININNAPEGMTFDRETKTLSWNVEDASPGNYNIEIVVSDEEGARTTQILELSVNQPNA